VTTPSRTRIGATLALLLTVVFGAGCARDRDSRSADMALKNGAIYTVDGARSWAQAVAIKDGRIMFVGTEQDLAAHVGPATPVVDLKGRMVLPGFQDAHVHPISSGLDFISCSLYDLEVFFVTGAGEAGIRKQETVDRYVEAIRKYAESHPDEPWITGGGWVMSAFGPGALARRELIDAVVPDRPVILWSTDGHSAWANTKALEIAGITKDTPDPPDGRIDRDPKTGEAIGSLQEGAADLVAAKIPPPVDAKRDEALRYSIRLLNGYGITTVQDAHVEPQELKAYRRADDSGELSLRVVASLWWEREQGLEQIDELKRLRDEYTRGRIDAGTVKIMQDGVMENYTAVVLEPYLLPDRPDERGIPMVDPERLKEAVTRLDAEGFQVHFHAIGDGAIRQSLDAVEAARRANGNSGQRHHISHLELIHQDDVPRFRELGVVANFQPLWAFADTYITDLTIPFIGAERSEWLYPIGSVYRSGAVVAFGSDWSVSTANPFQQIEVAVTRAAPIADQEVSPFLPEQRIDLPAAIAAFTINAAFVNRLDDRTGSIEVGKSADLAVLDRNLFDIPVSEISDTQVLVTLFEGKAVHGKLEDLQ
jgi:predicted amidohydrolase YtcJ